jgi:integrase
MAVDAGGRIRGSVIHTHATWLLGANTPVADVAARLGHSPVVLLNTYAHAVPRHEDAGIAAVGAMLYGK